MTDTRATRLAEVERLSRRPHADLHAKLIDAVLGALDGLTPEEWLTLAKRSPDRLIQSLSMSGRLAGYSERNEIQIDATVSAIHNMSDAESHFNAYHIAAAQLDGLVAALPEIADAVASPEARHRAIEAMISHEVMLQPLPKWTKPQTTPVGLRP
jgi:hypothetical protein